MVCTGTNSHHTSVSKAVIAFQSVVAVIQRHDVEGIVLAQRLLVESRRIVVPDLDICGIFDISGIAVNIQLKLNPDIRRLKMLLEPFRDFTLEVVPSGETGRG